MGEYTDNKNKEQLEAWRKRMLWANPGQAPLCEQEAKVLGAIVGYMARMLSRGQIPNVETVVGALQGTIKVNHCGYINCDWAEEHVH